MTTTEVAIVDIDIGNLRSLANSIRECGHDARVVRDPADIDGAQHVVLPGVGSFAVASGRLYDRGWVEVLRAHAAAGRPLMGVCLGMQLLATWGDEGGGSPGLDLIPGEITQLRVGDLRVPHMGWNGVQLRRDHPVFAEVKPERDFYFVHSYQFDVADERYCLATTDYGTEITTAVAKGSVLGLQFHPEKSQRNGLALLESFLVWNGADSSC